MRIWQNLKGTINRLIQNRRKRYQESLARKNKNKNPTIIANDCLGGMIYHTLGLKFNSPTINLQIGREDFLIFCEDLKGFLSAELKQVDTKETYPVGELTSSSKTIRLLFLHYKTFEEAKTKWDERKARVNYDNLYIIQTMALDVKRSEVERFDALPQKNKMLVIGSNQYHSKNAAIVKKLFKKKEFQGGMIFWWKGRFSRKRYMDDLNYVKFLNG